MLTLSWAGYGAFLAFALLICVSPGPDFAIVTRNALAGGRLSGAVTAIEVGIGSAVQGTIAAFGLGVVQGVLTNLTNPKVLVFYLSVLPQFLTPDAAVADALTLANSLPVIGTAWLLAIVAALHLLRRWVLRRRVRQALDATTGFAMIGLAGKRATDSH